jgi:hypothetical protein
MLDMIATFGTLISAGCFVICGFIAICGAIAIDYALFRKQQTTATSEELPEIGWLVGGSRFAFLRAWVVKNKLTDKSTRAPDK